MFGDGTVRILSTPGHTPGHQSLFVRLAKLSPDLSDQALAPLSPDGRTALEAMIRTDAYPEALHEALDRLYAWADG